MTATKYPTDPYLEQTMEDVYEEQRAVAAALTHAGLVPSNKNTMALLVLAAGNSQHARRRPMSLEDFLKRAVLAYNMAGEALVSHGPPASS